MLQSVLFVYILFLLGTYCDGQKNTKYCSVCRVVINEAEWLISQVDPKKSIQVGSFRVDPKGNQKIKDKRYARSEVHIEEIIESVCEKMVLYAEITFDDGTRQMVRTIGFNGRRLETKGFKLDMDKGESFKYKCENFLEDHEEEIIPVLQLENLPDYEKIICGEALEVCPLDDLWAPIFTLPEAEDEEIKTSEADNSDSGDAENGKEESNANEDTIDKDDASSPPSEKADEKTEL